MLNVIFILMFVLGISYSLITGRTDELSEVLLKSPRDGLMLVFEMSVLVIFWSGVLEVCKDSGLLEKITKPIKKITSRFFDMDKNEKALDYISINIAANILGLGAAAMPFGLKAIKEMHELNKKSNTASKDMITFLVLNVSMITIMPTSLIAIRNAYNSNNSTIVIPYVIVISSLTMIIALLINKGFKKYAK